MGTIGNMVVKLSLDDRDFDAGMKGAHSSVSSFVDKAGKIGGAMTASVTLPILGVAAAAVKMSTDFNASMANIASLGVPEAHVKEFKSAIQDLAIETGKSTSDIADGMYQVVSAFGDTKDTVKILTSNVKLAKAGLSSTSEAIALTSAVTKGYNDTSAEMVQHVADLSIQTVALGQTTLPELAGAMGTVTPLAGSLGVKMEDLYGVMATASGVTGSTSQVATQFRGILQSLMAPTSDMTDLTKKMGYANGEAMLKGEGLQKTIEAIVGASEATGKPLQSFIGSIEGQTLALALAGPQADAFTKNMAAMQDVAGKADAAFLAQTQGIDKVGFSMEQVQRYAEVLGQKVGDALAPLLAVALDKVQPLADALVDLVDQFAKADTNTQNWALAGLALLVAIGPLLMILPGIVAAVTAISAPVALAIGAVAILGAAWATNFGGIQEKTQAVIDALQPAFERLKGWLDMAMGGDWTGLQTDVQAALGEMKTTIVTFDWGGAGSAALLTLDTLKTSVVAAITAIDWGGALTTAGDFSTGLKNGVVSAITAIDWGTALATVGTAFTTARDNLLTLMTTAVTTIDWTAAITGMITSLTTVISTTDWSAVGKMLVATLALSFLSGFMAVQWVMDGKTWTNFATAVKDSFAKIDWAEVGASLSTLKDAIAKALGEFASGLTAGFSTPSWLASLLAWKFPDPTKLIDWKFPDPSKLIDWKFPDPLKLLDWDWPSIPIPDWVSRLFGGGPSATPATPSTQGYNTNPPALPGNTGWQGNIDITPPPPVYNDPLGSVSGIGAASLANIPGSQLGGWGGAEGAAASSVILNNYGPIASNIDIQALAFAVAQILSRRRA